MMTAFLLFGGLLGGALGLRQILLIGTSVSLGANGECLFASSPPGGMRGALAFPMAIVHTQRIATESAAVGEDHGILTVLAYWRPVQAATSTTTSARSSFWIRSLKDQQLE